MGFSPLEFSFWSKGEWLNSMPSGLIAGISNDTRTIRPGEMYVAIRGERFDGQRFVDDAFGRGASCALVDWAGAAQLSDSGMPLLVVADTVKALGDIAHNYRLKTGAVVIGVTGSVGKTTVKDMLASILSENGLTAKTVGNLNNEIGLPLSILKMPVGAEDGVFEIGMNHPGEIKKLAEIMAPDCAIITPIGPAHIEAFGSVEAIAEEKAALLEALPDDGTSVLWLDDPYYEILRSRVDNDECFTVSFGEQGDFQVIWHAERRELELVDHSISNEGLTVSWPHPGRHNALNAGLAGAMGWLLLGEAAVVKRGLENYSPAPMRWQVEKAGGLTIINDAYNANPLSMRAAIRTFAEQSCSGGKWLVLGVMKELGKHAAAEHFSLGEFVADSGDWRGVVVIGEFSERVAAGLEAGGFDSARVWRCEDNSVAADLLIEKLKREDEVLFKGSRGAALEEIINSIKNKEAAE